MLIIKKLLNNPIPSNCYVISNKINNSCIIVDPGTQDCKELLSVLQQEYLIPEFIILTHEHIDHTIGIYELLKHYKAKIICSSDCNNNINSLKYNLNGYSEKYEKNINMPTADILLEDVNYLLQWSEYSIYFYKAEGHSKGSIIFNIGNNLFTGDTLLKGHRTNTSFPGASKEKLIITFKKILSLFDKQITIVHSGHNKDFYLCELEENIKDQIEYLNNKISRKLQIKQYSS